MTTEQYKQMIIHDVIVEKINSITLEERLNNLIMLAQNERAMELNKVLFPERIGDLITEPESINPEDMIKGEWYFIKSLNNNDYIFKFTKVKDNYITYELCFDFCADRKTNFKYLCILDQICELRKATREEVLKYFPNEFDKEIGPHNII